MRRRAEIVLLAAVAAIGCGGRSRPTEDLPLDTPTDAGPDALILCGPPIDVYAPNMIKEGSNGRLAFQILESRPAPPRRGTNTFVVQVRDASGPLLVDLSVAPRVGRSHPALLPTITVDAPSATYTVDPVYLFMFGTWKIDMSARPVGFDAGPVLDSTQFVFCIDS